MPQGREGPTGLGELGPGFGGAAGALAPGATQGAVARGLCVGSRPVAGKSHVGCRWVCPEGWSSARVSAGRGKIPRVTPYERGMPPEHLRRTAEGTGWEYDQWIMDERFLAVRVHDKGLVVFTTCSHAGVVNVLTHARATFPDTPLHAVMGGLHLSRAGPEQVIPETVQGLTV